MATPSLKRLSPATMSWKRLMTPSCLKVAVTETGSVGATIIPSMKDSIHVRPRT